MSTESSRTSATSRPINVDAILDCAACAEWLGVTVEWLADDALKHSRAIPVFRLGHETIKYHPRTILAVLAKREGLSESIIAASFGDGGRTKMLGQSTMDLDKMLTPKEAAKWLRMSESDFKKKGRAGVIPVFKIGRRQVLAHPRTIIAKLATDAGVKRDVIKASFAWRVLADQR